MLNEYDGSTIGTYVVGSMAIRPHPTVSRPVQSTVTYCKDSNIHLCLVTNETTTQQHSVPTKLSRLRQNQIHM